MPTVKKSYQEHEKSQNKDGLWFLDHDSDQGYGEVEKLVLDMKVFLTGGAFDENQPLKLPFKKLQDVLASASETIEITKGIHQRENDPHIKFEIKGDPPNDVYVFHLELTAKDIDRKYADGQPVDRFLWKPCKLSVIVKSLKPNGKTESLYSSHPEGAVPRSMGRSRRFSITEGQIESHVMAVNKQIEREAEEERLKKEKLEEEARLKEEQTKKMMSDDSGFPGLGKGGPKPVAPSKPSWGKTAWPKK